MFHIGTPHSEIGEMVHGHILGMTGTTYDSQLFLWQTVHQGQVVCTDKILTGHNALDGSNQELGAHLDMQLLQSTFQEGGWENQYERLT